MQLEADRGPGRTHRCRGKTQGLGHRLWRVQHQRRTLSHENHRNRWCRSREPGQPNNGRGLSNPKPHADADTHAHTYADAHTDGPAGSAPAHWWYPTADGWHVVDPDTGGRPCTLPRHGFLPRGQSPPPALGRASVLAAWARTRPLRSKVSGLRLGFLLGHLDMLSRSRA